MLLRRWAMVITGDQINRRHTSKAFSDPAYVNLDDSLLEE
jgi:hypothetical protein